jgi:GNAT superfamily N-acetyltransferase
MISCLRDDSGRITAVCEWLTFEGGQLQDKGTDVFIGEFEVNPEHKGNGVFKKLIRKVYESNPQFRRVFWWREYKYPNSGARIYSREQILKHIGG